MSYSKRNYNCIPPFDFTHFRQIIIVTPSTIYLFWIVLALLILSPLYFSISFSSKTIQHKNPIKYFPKSFIDSQVYKIVESIVYGLHNKKNIFSIWWDLYIVLIQNSASSKIYFSRDNAFNRLLNSSRTTSKNIDDTNDKTFRISFVSLAELLFFFLAVSNFLTWMLRLNMTRRRLVPTKSRT